MQALSTTNFNFKGQTAFYKGKVRDVYTIEDKWLVMVVTDRVSAFDVVLPRAIPYKGAVLNQIAAHFMEATSHIVPNWIVAVPDEQVTIGIPCDPLKVEMVIRGYLSGHAWREYRSGKRMLCGVKFPEGLHESDLCPRPSSHQLPRLRKDMIRISARTKSLSKTLYRKPSMSRWSITPINSIKKDRKWLLHAD